MAGFIILVVASLFSQVNAALSLPRSQRSGAAFVQAAIHKKMRNMSVHDAMAVVGHHKGAPKELPALLQRALEGGVQHHSQAFKKHFRGHHKLAKEDPSGYGGGTGAAEEMLSNMVTESEMNLDAEMERCEIYDGAMKSQMEITRQDISNANAMNAAGRAELMRANAQIEYFEKKIPETQKELKDHNEECAVDIAALNAQIDVVKQDLSVMDTVVNMSQCSDSATSTTNLLETSAALHCCNHTNSVEQSVYMKLNHGPLAKLKSAAGQWLLKNTFPVARPVHSRQSVSFAQFESEVANGYFVVSQPTTPVVVPKVCPEEAAAKCTIADSPACPRIRNKFLGLQSEIREKLKDLEKELEETEGECEDTRLNLEAQISGMSDTLLEEQTAASSATEQMNQADEQSRLKQKQLTDERTEFVAEMRTCTVYEGGIECDDKDGAGVCSENINAYMTEICGLKKIRTELAKIEGDNMTVISDITDCEVSEWTTNGCSKSCGGGELVKERTVVVQPDNGATCPPLKITEACNIDPCPVDCVHSDWSEWSSCSASCAGGIKERERGITTYASFGGEECGDTTEAVDCNVFSCDADCELSQWTEWCGCNKECDGGMQRRVRPVSREALGQGTCPEELDETRTEWQQCNTQPCAQYIVLPDGHPYLQCHQKMDVILLLDGSGSVGATGWAATIEFTKTFIQALDLGPDTANVAVLVFSGPWSNPNFDYCDGTQDVPSSMASSWDPMAACSMTWVEHFTDNSTVALEKLDAMSHPSGTTMTSLALELAMSELADGREDTPSVVVVVTDGVPNSKSNTAEAAAKLKEKSRLLWALVGSNIQRVRPDVEKWASVPYVSNIIDISDFDDLTAPDTVNGLLADFCVHLERQSCPYTANDGYLCPETASGDCSSSANTLYIAAGGAAATEGIKTAEDAEVMCGAICDSQPECGGFEWTNERCTYKRRATTAESECASATPEAKEYTTCFVREDYSCTDHPVAGGALVSGSVV